MIILRVSCRLFVKVIKIYFLIEMLSLFHFFVKTLFVFNTILSSRNSFEKVIKYLAFFDEALFSFFQFLIDRFITGLPFLVE
jgi:hypothetical protein